MKTALAPRRIKFSAPKCRDCRYSRRDPLLIFHEEFRMCVAPHTNDLPSVGRGHYADIQRDDRYRILDMCGPAGHYFIQRRTFWQWLRNLWLRDPQP
jgi:hypothetical protein